MNAEQAKKLREPFKPEQIGKLPKAGIMLDYVGHAATTDRLLQVDPEWTWEPMAYDERGLPLIVNNSLWIRLTVCGVTRPGFGDGKNPKEIIGDAIRNAAMRFGVALDLWAKEDLHAEPEQRLGPPNVELVDKLLGLCDILGVRARSEDGIRAHAGDEAWLRRQIKTAEENIRRLNTPAEDRAPA